MRFEPLKDIGTLAVVGAHSPVGREFLELLDENQVSIRQIRRLAGSDKETADELEPLQKDSFEGVDVAFFCAGPDVAKRFAPLAAQAGCIVVDDSGAFRADGAVPLVVPSVNGATLREFQGNLIATPVCGATPLAMVLKPLHDTYGINRVTIATYQSASEAGIGGYETLSRQTAQLLNGQQDEETEPLFAHPLAFNCIPLIGSVESDGSSSEERRIVDELRRVLDLPALRVSITAVRVPTFAGFGAAVNVELKRPVASVTEARELLDDSPDVKVVDNPGSHIYPTNRESLGSDFAFVGRVRTDASIPGGISFWLMTDNLRRGTALNALECLETLYKYRRMS